MSSKAASCVYTKTMSCPPTRRCTMSPGKREPHETSVETNDPPYCCFHASNVSHCSFVGMSGMFPARNRFAGPGGRGRA
jgi:hypothetical protein